jgi:ATP-dependent helicase HepA
MGIGDIRSAPAKAPVGSLVNVQALSQLGVGKLHKYDELGRAVVHFSGEGTRIIAANTPVVRARLGKATPVRFRTAAGEAAAGKVLEFLVQREDGGFVYRIASGGEVHDVWEGHIMPGGSESDPLQLLKTYRWDTPKSYIARWSMADIFARWYAVSGGFPAMLGARILPLGHQLYAARRVLFDRRPRFILADEVGLGKTIEAGLIVQALQAENRDFSVLVVAPGSMSRQWLSETYLRFGARAYHHIDCSRMTEESNASISRLIASPRVIVATTALQEHAKLAELVTKRRWNMVVVDEAHQIPPGSALYSVLEHLADRSDGLLLLSATPSKRDVAGLMGLLALVSPDAYRDQPAESLQIKYDRQSAIWDRLNFTRKLIDATAGAGRALDPDEAQFIAEEWVGLIEGDDLLDELLRRIRDGDSEAAIELVAYVQEFHRLDHRIIRTRRATLHNGNVDWPRRELVEIPCSPTQAQAIFLRHLEDLPTADGDSDAALRALYQRFCTTSAASAIRFLDLRSKALDDQPEGKIADPIGRIATDSGPNDEPIVLEGLIRDLRALDGETNWLRTARALATAWKAENCSRTDALGDWLNSHIAAADSNQVLVFTQDTDTADDLADRLEHRFGKTGVARFHCRIKESDLASTAFRFQHDKRCRVLVSDELGGEGRNFQNASAVVHFDLPASCARIEQRIGRLDRVGRPTDRPVLSVVLEPATDSEAALLETQRDVFQVFTRTIGGLEFVLPKMQRDVLTAYGEGSLSLRAHAATLGKEVEASLNASDEAFDLSLDATKPQLDRSIALAAQITEESNPTETANVVGRWASRLGFGAIRLQDGNSEFRWTNGSLNISSDRLKIGTGADDERRLVSGTFARSTALEREDLQYFAPGHDLVDAMIYEAEHGLHSRVTAFLLEGFSSYRGTVLLHVLGRSALEEGHWNGHDIGAGLAARARSLLWPEVMAEIMLLWNKQGAHHDVVTHAGLRSALDHPNPNVILRSIEPGTVSSLDYLPQLWSAIDIAVPKAIASIARRRAADAAERANTLEASLRAELGYLRWRVGTATKVDDAEAYRAAISARQALVQSLRSPRVDLLGLALVALA